VLKSCINYEHASDTERDGVTQSQLQAEVEQQLKSVGLRVLSQEEWKQTPSAPYLYVSVAGLKKSDGLYADAIEGVSQSARAVDLSQR
jgi:hypothetical protein